MLSFLKEELDYKEVYLIYSRLLKKLEEEDLISYSKFFNINTPVSRNEIITSIENIIKNNDSLFRIISKDLNILSFDSLIDVNIKDCFVFNDGVIYNEVLYLRNPYSEKVDILNENIKNNNTLLFNKIGFISNKYFYFIENEVKKNNIKKINSLYLDKKIQEVFSLAINNKAKKIRIKNSKNGILVSILKEDYIDININIGNSEEYNNVINYIDSKFNNLTNWFYNDFNYKIIYQKEDYKTEEREDSIIYFKLYYNQNIMDLEDINIPFKEKEVFYRSLESPSGIILVSGIMESGKQERIYSILNYFKDKNISITSIEDLVKKEIGFVSQYEVGMQNNFDYKIFNSKIIAYHEINKKEDVDYLLSESSKGKLIIAGINSVSSISAISKILSLEINKKVFSELLLCVLHSDLVKKVCPYCSINQKYISDKNYNHFIDLENSPAPHHFIKKENKKGCYHCVSGYKDHVLITELLENDKILTEEIINDFNIEKIKLEKRSSSWKNSFESGIEHVKNGNISINSLINSLGFYKK